ncbi:hypothetical protein MLD38_004656 [Melastoma candidum]|uniref:Uncharacterized protein n=1 Tax=Melastoma candidum TaxID=119954 RepID=A0ACB9SAA4_9MYRT|nr:hypothetical protein MLD38_004656 [Melastoma candidum]
MRRGRNNVPPIPSASPPSATAPPPHFPKTVGLVDKLAIGGGLVSTPVIAWSLYMLKTTGCGLPAGPGGAIGVLGGVSYLGLLKPKMGIVGWLAYTKAMTGSGLPNGPFGLLAATVEGLSYLSLLGIAVVFGLQSLDKGYIPVPLPADQCFDQTRTLEKVTKFR